jgi:hypothetical protein
VADRGFANLSSFTASAFPLLITVHSVFREVIPIVSMFCGSLLLILLSNRQKPLSAIFLAWRFVETMHTLLHPVTLNTPMLQQLIPVSDPAWPTHGDYSGERRN